MFASLWKLIVEVFALRLGSVISYFVLFLQVFHKSPSQVINCDTEPFSQHALFFLDFHGKEQDKTSFNYLCLGMYHILMLFIINVYIQMFKYGWQTCHLPIVGKNLRQTQDANLPLNNQLAQKHIASSMTSGVKPTHIIFSWGLCLKNECKCSLKKTHKIHRNSQMST